MRPIPIALCTLLLASLALALDAPTEGPTDNSAKISGVGTVMDPAGDCRVAGNAERLVIAIPGSDHALATEQNRMNAPRVLQEVSGDFSVEVTVSGTYPKNAGTVVPERLPFQGAGLLLWVDARTYIRLERAQVRAEVEGSSEYAFYPSWELRVEGKPLRMGGGSDPGLTASPTTLRLTRTGNKVTAAISDDGVTWRELDPLIVNLPEKVQIGVVAGHNTTAPFETTFEKYHFTPLGTGKN